MEFIGISGKLNESVVLKLIGIANDLNIKVVKNDWNYDSEVSNGLKYFTDKVKDNFLLQLVLEKKGNQKTTTSNLLTEELNSLVISKEKSIFIQFLGILSNQKLPIEGLHLIFASEWEDASQNVRLIRTDLKGVKDYLIANNGWYLVFYSIKTQSYIYELDSPLIFEIQ
jgi:hypothetical protein